MRQCEMESEPSSHPLQPPSMFIPLFFSLSTTGRHPIHAHQIKIFALGGTGIFHNFLQFLSRNLVVNEPNSPSQPSPHFLLHWKTPTLSYSVIPASKEAFLFVFKFNIESTFIIEHMKQFDPARDFI
ncbi:hypothetical protein Droror1_Dr00013835 [Drosera rotundifolia]